MEQSKNKPKIFIDGHEGTTGLQIYDRLSERKDITLLHIDESKRKDSTERKKLINEADMVFLCLPDSVAKESVSLLENNNTRIIDASTAHRTNPGWVYGFAELSKKHREEIINSKRVANPGCHATGIIASVYPLISLKIMPADYPLTCFSLTGYSGGGKSMIYSYEHEKTPEMFAPRIYGLDLQHKHLPEIMHVTGLTKEPVFCPIVDDYYNGMATTIMIHNDALLKKYSSYEIKQNISDYYAGERFVTVSPELGNKMLESNWGTGTETMELTVSGNNKTTIITARFDNLGKGASAAAIQNMNLMLGLKQ